MKVARVRRAILIFLSQYPGLLNNRYIAASSLRRPSRSSARFGEIYREFTPEFFPGNNIFYRGYHRCVGVLLGVRL